VRGRGEKEGGGRRRRGRWESENMSEEGCLYLILGCIGKEFKFSSRMFWGGWMDACIL
jgi:hypothetical protein